MTGGSTSSNINIGTNVHKCLPWKFKSDTKELKIFASYFLLKFAVSGKTNIP